ncbi:MAG: dienelactone hydrolase family protein [Myxococcota bacterium]|nr:dienelactone hydrolase family protein [Myxococcota bacterium]
MEAQEDELGHLALPDTPTQGRLPGVVMIPDVWGLADHTRDLAQRLAAEGFAVRAVDVYRKTGRPDISDPSEAMPWIASLSDPLVLETLQEAVDDLAARPDVGAVGITGFCMGGMYALLAACGCRGIAACAPFYGMLRYDEGLDPERKPRSPLDAIPDLTCPVLGLYGEDDALISVAEVRELEKGLAATGHDTEVVLYSGAGHAFMNDTREAMYRPEAARDAWARLVPFLRRHLAT